MSLTPDTTSLSDSIWPYDTGKAPDTSPPQRFDKFRCFVMCPFARADLMLSFVNNAAVQIQKVINHHVEVYYAGDIAGPGPIHPDIWANIKQADIVVVDITGYNPNVVYELGVAAAWRPIGSVVVIRDKSDDQQHAFDLSPARQRIYDSRERGWMANLAQWLTQDIWAGLSQAPFRDEPHISIALPLKATFLNGQDDPRLWSPAPGHRRLTAHGLEFGSFFHFQYSWLSPASIRLSNVHVRTAMRFSDIADATCWIGVAVRAQGYLANYQHLVWLSWDGKVMRTGPDKNPESKDEHLLCELPGFNPHSEEYEVFDIHINDGSWSIKVGDMKNIDIALASLPYVYGPGRILLRTFNCRAFIRDVVIEAC